MLVPMAVGPEPPWERAVGVIYPLLDFVALVPTLIMLRITLGFLGGNVWTVWAMLLLSLIFSALGDVINMKPDLGKRPRAPHRSSTWGSFLRTSLVGWRGRPGRTVDVRAPRVCR